MIRDLMLMLIGAGVLGVFTAPWAKTYDEKKWERLEQHRIERRANEARFNACYWECLK